MSAGNDKTLSIIIPVYNREKIVMRTLDSIAAQQSIENTDIILVDNNSSDGSLQILSQWATVMKERGTNVTVLTEKRPGAAAARNRGIEAVATPWLMFFDSDDIMLPGHVSAVQESIEAHPQTDIIGWDILQQLPSLRLRRARFSNRNLIWNVLMHSVLSSQRYAVRTPFINSSGNWNDTMQGWDDLELGIRLAVNSPKVHYRKGKPLVQTFFTAESLTGSSFSEHHQQWEKALDSIHDTLQRNSIPATWVDVRRMILAATYAREGNRQLAKSTKDAILARHRFSKRALLRLIYLKHRLIPAGTTTFASLFLKKF